MDNGLNVAPAILVVDDNAQNRALALATLQGEGYDVVTVASGRDALAVFVERPFDCVLLDVRMPEMDGFTLCRHIRAHERGQHVPILFLTAARDVDTFDEAFAAGGDDFLVKPVQPTELIVRVQGALKMLQLAAENREYFRLAKVQRDALLRLQLQKEQLTAFLVHDLKNPVNALDLHAQLLARDKNLSERSQASVAAIRQEARQLMRLLTNMLELSKSEAEGLAPRRTNVRLVDMFETLRPEFELRARSKDVTLENVLEVDSLEADPDMLRRVIENLLDNAIRHAPHGTRVTVSFKPSDDAVELRVADQGRGVAEEASEHVFERLVQANKASSGEHSYGLGLAFCKLAAELHGGRIWIEDAEPGAVFCVRFPC